MKLYYYTDERFAVQNLERQHLKISFSTEVNDLFELKPFDFGKREIRRGWQKSIEEHAKTQGFISFSASWDVPTMWAHYANNHKGLCYAFELSSVSILKINYVHVLRPFNERALSDQSVNDVEVDYASRTKSAHWEYEDEWRQYVSLSDDEVRVRRNGENVFLPFSNQLRLCEVLIGARSKISSSQVEAALPSADGITIRTMRASFRDYRIVEQQSASLKK